MLEEREEMGAEGDLRTGRKNGKEKEWREAVGNEAILYTVRKKRKRGKNRSENRLATPSQSRENR